MDVLLLSFVGVNHPAFNLQSTLHITFILMVLKSDLHPTC